MLFKYICIKKTTSKEILEKLNRQQLEQFGKIERLSSKLNDLCGKLSACSISIDEVRAKRPHVVLDVPNLEKRCTNKVIVSMHAISTLLFLIQFMQIPYDRKTSSCSKISL